MGKGSSQRPTDKAAFDSGYERVFGKTRIHTTCSHGNTRSIDPSKFGFLFQCLTCGEKFNNPTSKQNQTCGNCKHWSRHHDHHPARCANIDLVDMIDTDGGYWGFESPADFSCSLWKAKP